MGSIVSRISLGSVVLVAALSANTALARQIELTGMLDCTPTPRMETWNYPSFKSIPTSNDLLRPAGKADAYAIAPVQVVGRVFDSACVPVADAKIELWHADDNGRFRVAKASEMASANPVFLGAGRATSNNDGQFIFTTLYPPVSTIRAKRADGTPYTITRAPHLNVRISHDALKTFNTALFFHDEPENDKDARLKKLAEDKRPYVLMKTEPMGEDAAAGIRAFIDIVLPQQQPFRKY